MAQRDVATMTTSSAADGSEVGNFTLKAEDFEFGNPVVSVSGLAGAETASLRFRNGSAFVNANDSSGTIIGFAVDAEAVAITSPGEYAFIKDATAGALTVYVTSGAD